jgi:hypothetical protein
MNTQTTHKQCNTSNIKTTLPLEKITEESGCLARWIALYEAVNIIADKGEEKGIKLEKIEFKPLDIKDYIEGVQDIIHRKILAELYGIHIHTNEEN